MYFGFGGVFFLLELLLFRVLWGKKKARTQVLSLCGNILLRVKLKVNSFSTLRINSLATACERIT